MANFRAAAIVLGLASTAVAWGMADAQTAPKPPAAASPAPAQDDPVKAAFLAMPESDRKAVQDGLAWLNLYNGVVDGTFGKRTLDSIRNYQNRLKAKADGMVSADQLASLKAEADKARAALGFVVFDEPATGIRIGAPSRLLDRKTSEKDRFRWASRDGSIVLELAAPSGPDATLDALYRTLSADAPDRKISYKALKRGVFFVVATEEADKKFYARYAQSPAGAVRGFVFSYPSARAGELDRVGLAVANAFDPFPTPGAAPSPAANAPAAAVAKPASVPAPAPPGPTLVATALVVAAGRAVTALTPAECGQPLVGGKSVDYASSDPATGLAVIAGDMPERGGPLVLAAGRPDAAFVLSLAPGAAGKASILEFSSAEPLAMEGGRVGYVASLGLSARGAPVVDRRGALLGLIAPLAAPPRRIAGVTIAEPHVAISGPAFAAALGASGTSPETAASPAEIAKQLRGRIVGVYCAP